MRVGIIGAGMGRYGLAPAFLQNGRFHLAAVCASRKEKAEAFAKEFRVEKAFDSWQSLLEEDLDLIAIATPPKVQGEIALACLERKIPVFLEKQISIDLEEATRLSHLARLNQVPTCVNFIFPYLRTWQHACRLLRENRLGKLRHAFINWRMESYDNARRTPDIWKTDDALGGGVLQHFLSHSLQYAEHFFGKIQELNCFTRPAPDLGAKGTAFASLDLIFEDGMAAHIGASNSAYRGTGHSLEIYGSEGSLFLKNESADPVLGFELFFGTRGSPFKKIGAEADHRSEKTGDSRVAPTARLVALFFETLSGGKAMHPTIEDGCRIQELLHHAQTPKRTQGIGRC